jgi:hypothetical protein
MSDPTDATAMISTIAEKIFTIAECPECETFTGARRAWCLNESQDITRSNKWRRGFNLPPLGVTHTTRPRITQEATAEWTPDQPARGLGDVIAKVTHATGIDRLVKRVAKGGCGCKGRQKKLNELVPFGGES